MRSHVPILVASSFAACFAVAISSTPAAAQNKCAGEKIKAAGKKADCKAGLEAKQASKGGTIDPAKIARCESRHSFFFARNEAKGNCATTGDAATVEAKVDAFVADLDTELAVGTLPNTCQGEKIKAAGKKAACKLGLEAKQASKGGTIDPAKVAKCESKLSSMFAKNESKGGCNTTGDAAAIEAKVDAFVADAANELDPTTTTSTTTSTTTTTIPTVCGDGSITGSEECDDGGTLPGDGCSATCQLESVNPAVCAGVPTVSGTDLEAALFASNLEAPVHIAGPRLDPSRVFIVEQPGRIQLVKNGVQQGTPFLAIEGIVRYSQFGEEGLLSVAFDPDYETNGFFYVYYVLQGGPNDGALRISRFTVSGNPDVADDTSEHVIATIAHPASNHNGGNLNFGPDGFLYAATGDGGGGGDPLEAAQNDLSMLGKLLRIDVDTDAVTIWGKGLRNPFRFSFDRSTGDLYIGDVGQGRWEEISYDPAPVSSGVNYGWDDMEGRHCFEPMIGCLTAGRELPVLEYCNSAHSDAACDDFQAEKGQAVIAGFVYRGCTLPDLQGEFFYSDTYNTWIKTFEGVSLGNAQNLVDRSTQLGAHIVTSFGEDTRGELYFTDYGDGGAGNGDVYKIVPAN
jgi:cysteine-rich repeat protein